MSKKKQPKYFDPPSAQQMADMERRIAQTKEGERNKMKHKIDPYVATVSTCIREGKSARHIVKIVMLHHKVKLSKDTVLRFAKAASGRYGNDASTDQPMRA